MDAAIKDHFERINSKDANARYESFQYIIQFTQQPVDWAYDVWDDLLLLLKKGDNHQRTMAAQLLANLAKSDPDHRMVNDAHKIFEVTRDEKFVTARHSLQSLWKIAIVNVMFQKKITEYLSYRFNTCNTEKNYTLIRYDIIEVLRKIYNNTNDEAVKQTAFNLIEIEKDLKYRKKYTIVWKDVFRFAK